MVNLRIQPLRLEYNFHLKVGDTSVKLKKKMPQRTPGSLNLLPSQVLGSLSITASLKEGVQAASCCHGIDTRISDPHLSFAPPWPGRTV